MKLPWPLKIWLYVSLLFTAFHFPHLFSPQIRMGSPFGALAFSVFFAIEVLACSGIAFMRWWGSYLLVFVFFKETLQYVLELEMGIIFKITWVLHGLGLILVYVFHKRMRTGL
jgi:hypothetical protein